MSTLHPPYNCPPLREEWQQKCAFFCKDVAMINNAFDKLQKAYTDTSRHYHNLTHIENMLVLLEQYKQGITKPETLYFAIWYHDAVYKTLKKNSEEKSAALAVKELTALSMNSETVNRISEYICATKAHAATQDKNLQWLLDFDLSILGADPDVYNTYAKAVRKEYSIYPAFLYNKGRRKALQHFLEKPYIFQTIPMQKLYEKQARSHIKAELDAL